MCSTCQCPGVNALSTQADARRGKLRAPLKGIGQALRSLVLGIVKHVSGAALIPFPWTCGLA